MQKWQPCIIQSSVKYIKWIIQHCLLLHSQLSQPSVHRWLAHWEGFCWRLGWESTGFTTGSARIRSARDTLLPQPLLFLTHVVYVCTAYSEILLFFACLNCHSLNICPMAGDGQPASQLSPAQKPFSLAFSSRLVIHPATWLLHIFFLVIFGICFKFALSLYTP